jgi:alanyl-tRNA synthetase
MNISELNPVASSRKMNNLMESRFGFALDYNRLTYAKAQHLHSLVNENIARIRHSFGIHKAERNPRYMELLMVRESLGRWMNENQQLMESEMGKSEAILAAKDMVDSIQDMVEKVSKMQVEQLPALIDTIRDQIGMAEADSFKNAMGQLLTNISQELATARETADTSARQLAGEDMAGGGLGGMGMAGGMGSDTLGAPTPGGLDAGGMGDMGSDLDADIDSFAGTDAAAGGEAPVGREKR